MINIKSIIILVCVISAVSCDKEEKTTTVFENHTEWDIEIAYFNKAKDFQNSFKIDANDIKEFIGYNNNTGRIPPTIAGVADSCIVIFGNGKSLSYSKTFSPTEKDILNTDDYEYSFQSDYNEDAYNYNYFITSEHLEKAE